MGFHVLIVKIKYFDFYFSDGVQSPFPIFFFLFPWKNPLVYLIKQK